MCQLPHDGGSRSDPQCFGGQQCMQRRHFRSWPIGHQIMQSPSLDPAQQWTIWGPEEPVLWPSQPTSWTGLACMVHRLDLVGWRGSTLNAGVSSDLRATKETRESHSCPVHDGPSMFGDVVSGCGGWRCFDDALHLSIMRSAKCGQAPLY